MEIVKFYQEGRAEAGADVWEKMGAASPTEQYAQLPAPQTQQTPYRPAPTPPTPASPSLDTAKATAHPGQAAPPIAPKPSLSRSNTNVQVEQRAAPPPPQVSSGLS